MPHDDGLEASRRKFDGALIAIWTSDLVLRLIAYSLIDRAVDAPLKGARAAGRSAAAGMPIVFVSIDAVENLNDHDRLPRASGPLART
jgi:hypothetical protein